MPEQKTNKENFFALLPLLIFVLLFLGTGILSKDFSKMPLSVAVITASAVALMMNRKESLAKKVDIFCRGAGHPNIILMCLIFILAGAFAGVAKEMGAVESTVNLGLSILPENLLMPGLFIIGCFISLSMGTSMGTVVALAPIGVGIAQQTDISMALAMATVIGGAMFGDNLSVISDTTIAAVRTQNTKMNDKFKVNFFIVLPGAIITAIILAAITAGNHGAISGSHTYEWVKILPYVAVLISALAGVNVLVVLLGGTIFAGIVGFTYGSYDFSGFLQTVAKGVASMEDLAIISLLIGGTVELIHYNGGIQYLLHFITSKIKSRKGAEFGIAGLVSVVDVATANNTISIVITGPLAKEIADQYGIDARKSASLLDMFSSVWQGIVPYGGQFLAAAGLASISPVSMMPYSFYPVLMGICGVIAILIHYPRNKKETAAAKNAALNKNIN
ncbi:Na+/H+ antiporter NhaC family protein [Heyndrickxia acidiproducens]|uniref:Na+/H+ antiporter NhaC family protein n=1 Tax=Heyndrickxia acidiproducens TaxID=1121084 RepID=UPI00037D1759|nr:Na+/H+ antiporter NhaC family protein [Heyndrickxia acidiproducens]